MRLVLIPGRVIVYTRMQPSTGRAGQPRELMHAVGVIDQGVLNSHPGCLGTGFIVVFPLGQCGDSVQSRSPHPHGGTGVLLLNPHTRLLDLRIGFIPVSYPGHSHLGCNLYHPTGAGSRRDRSMLTGTHLPGVACMVTPSIRVRLPEDGRAGRGPTKGLARRSDPSHSHD